MHPPVIDTNALLAEIQTDPAAGPAILESLAARMQTLQASADDLRLELATLQQHGGTQPLTRLTQALRGDLRELIGASGQTGLNPAIISMLAFDGQLLRFATPAPFEQSFPLDGLGTDDFASLRPVMLMAGRALSTLVGMTSSFRLVRFAGPGARVAPVPDWGSAAPSTISLMRAERIESAMVLNEAAPPERVTVISRAGWVRAVSWATFELALYSGQPLATRPPGDAPAAIITGGAGDVLLITRSAQWIRLPFSAIGAGGVDAMPLSPTDDLAAAAVITSDVAAVHVVGEDGAMFSVLPDALPPHKKLGGKPGALPRGFKPLACFGVPKPAVLLTLSNDGHFDVVSLKSIPVAGRISEAQPLRLATRRLVAATPL